jgi:imidazolonepropionase-like amidohydrolase
VTEETTAFANAMIFDGMSAELREGCVRVAAGTIAEVGEGPEPGDRVIDCRGYTIVPGLIDAHFHAYGISLSPLEIETSPLSYLALAGARRLAGALGRGFTTVRDPGGGDAGLARAIREGLTAAPRYLFCGPALSQTGGHGDPRPPELGCCLGGGHMAEVVDGVDALRRAVRERLRSGAHSIKIMASGGVISPSDPLRVPQYSPEEIRAVAEEATRRGSYVAAHAYSAEAIQAAVANGVRSVEHGNLLNAPAAALMAERDAFLVPTLVAYDAMKRRGAELGLAPVAQAKNREVLDAGRAAIRLAREAGVRIGFGTDLMGALDDEQLHGLRLQAEVDGPLALLRAATSVNAELLGRDDLGRIRSGRGRRPARPGRRSAAGSVRAVGQPGPPGRVPSWHQGGRQGGQADAVVTCQVRVAIGSDPSGPLG